MPVNPLVKAEVVRNLIKHEKKINHFYLDSEGFVTVGVGHMMPTKLAATQVVMNKLVNKQPGPPASVQEK